MGICRAGWAETDIAELALDFLLSAKQDAAAVKRFLAKALGRRNHPVPRVINTDKHAYPPAIVQLKEEGVLVFWRRTANIDRRNISTTF
jgi:transposase-like protein